MTPTLDWVYGAETQTTALLNFGAGGTGAWDSRAVSTTPFTFPAGRTGVCLHCVEPGTASAFLSRVLPSTQHRVVSCYFRVPSAPVTNNSAMLQLRASSTIMARFDIASTGIIRAAAATGVRQDGPAVSDNAWHLLDFWLDSSGTTWTVHWTVDGAAQTNATQGSHVATDVTNIFIGTGTSTDNLTFDIDDLVTGTTSAEYPYGTHQVNKAVPNADGTHNNIAYLYSESTVLIDGTTTPAWSRLDEWPANTTDYVKQIAASSGGYVELAFEDTTATNIWAVQAVAAMLASGNTGGPNNGEVVIVDGSANTLLILYSGAMMDKSVNYKDGIVPAPTGGWVAGFNGVKARVGFSTAVSPIPYWTSLLLEYVSAPNSYTATAAVAGTGTVAADALHSAIATASVAGTGTVQVLSTNVIGAITGSKWDTTDQTWNDASHTWDGAAPAANTWSVAAQVQGGGAIAGTLTRSALTFSVVAGVMGNGGPRATLNQLVNIVGTVAGTGTIAATLTRTAPGTVDVLGTGTIAATALHTALATASVTGRGTILATLVGSGSVINTRIIQKMASFDKVVPKEASYDYILPKEASTLGVKQPITVNDNWFVGEDQTFQFTSITSGAPDNIAGWTLSFRLAAAAGRAAILTIAGTITDASGGVFTVATAAADTAAITPGTYYYDVSRTDTGNNQVLAFGAAHLQARVS